MPYLWIDGVYGRDTNAAQGNSDSSILVLNPKPRQPRYLGIRSFLKKDDIIDVMAHIRGTIHMIPTNVNYPKMTDLDELWFCGCYIAELQTVVNTLILSFRTLFDTYTQ
jgi:hypothetical protein